MIMLPDGGISISLHRTAVNKDSTIIKPYIESWFVRKATVEHWRAVQGRWRRHQSKPNRLWCRVRGIRTTGRLGPSFLECKRLRIVWSETFTPAVVRNSCVNVRALSVRLFKLRVLMNLSWLCFVTLVPPELALSHTELVALKWLKTLEIVLGATPNVPVQCSYRINLTATSQELYFCHCYSETDFYPYYLTIQNQY
jgi:hypothetical protein